MKKSSVKERILRLARQRFLEQGFYKTSMDSLVQELGTSKSSLYNHFRSKEDLVGAVVRQLNLEIDHKLETILTADRLNFQQKLVAVSKFTKELLTNVSEHFLKDLEWHTPELWEWYQNARRQRIDRYYRKLFGTGVQEGIIRSDIQPDLLLLIYLSLTEIPPRFESADQLKQSNQSIYEDITEVFLHGIIARSPSDGQNS